MKKFILFLFGLIFSFSVFAQTVKNTAEKKETAEESVTKETSNFGFYFGPQIIFSDTVRDYDPKLGISGNIGFEYEYQPIKYFSLNPSLDISIFHYDFLQNSFGGQAYICEIETRTAFTIAFLADLPAMATFDVDSWIFSAGGGLAFLLRGAFLEPGVKADDVNSDGTSVKDALKSINSYFWKNGRFFYTSLGFKIEYKFDSGWKTGFKFKSFIPVLNVMDSSKKKFSDSLILQMSIILHPPKM